MAAFRLSGKILTVTENLDMKIAVHYGYKVYLKLIVIKIKILLKYSLK